MTVGFFSFSRDIFDIVIIRVRSRPMGRLKALSPFTFNLNLSIVLYQLSSG